MSVAPQALVLAGDGINCERETSDALRLVGFDPQVQHLNDLIEQKVDTDQLNLHYSVVALPGGFSFGDDLGSGRVLALKIKHALKWNLREYVKRGGLVIGICNGFQALVHLKFFGEDVSITHNLQNHFIDKWVSLNTWHDQCAWLRGVGNIELPLRHGEGRIVVSENHSESILRRLESSGMSCLRYEESPNGSFEKLAGLCDETGRIFGLMPHPEAFVRSSSHPDTSKRQSQNDLTGDGIKIFEAGFKAAMEAT